MPEHQQTQKSTESKTTSQKQTTPRIQAPISHPMAIIQRARINPKSLTHADVMQLQRTIGNRAVGRLLSEIGLFPSTAKPIQKQEITEKEETCPSCMQKKEIPEEEKPFQTKRENNTGMPDNLKAGVENLSGIDMSDVRVHYNSSKPAEVGALAYNQGTDIHVAPGQERHLPHEAWHVVQQTRGRVRPTMQMKECVPINDDVVLEQEADVMGAKALQADDKISKGTIQKKISNVINQKVHQKNGTSDVVIQRELAKNKLNVVGETHSESNARRVQEINYTKKIIGNTAGYWREYQFTVNNKADWGDPRHLRLAHLFNINEEYFTSLEQKIWQLVPGSSGVGELLVIIRKNLQIGRDRYFKTLIDDILADYKLIEEEKNPFKGELATMDFKNLNMEFKNLKSQGQKLNISLTEGIIAIDNYNIKKDKTNYDLNYLFLELWVICNDIKEYKEYGSKLINENFSRGVSIQELRSAKMNEAANQGSNQLGIWKIGQEHVKDIQTNTDKNDLKYELVGKEDFDYYLLVD